MEKVLQKYLGNLNHFFIGFKKNILPPLFLNSLK